MKKTVYDTGYNTTMMLWLRRTLVRSVIQLNRLQVSLLMFNFKLNDNQTSI